jgi:hypothetical protein
MVFTLVRDQGLVVRDQAGAYTGDQVLAASIPLLARGHKVDAALYRATFGPVAGLALPDSEERR